jgi:hypothetical protein
LITEAPIGVDRDPVSNQLPRLSSKNDRCRREGTDFDAVSHVEEHQQPAKTVNRPSRSHVDLATLGHAAMRHFMLGLFSRRPAPTAIALRFAETIADLLPRPAVLLTFGTAWKKSKWRRPSSWTPANPTLRTAKLPLLFRDVVKLSTRRGTNAS